MELSDVLAFGLLSIYPLNTSLLYLRSGSQKSAARWVSMALAFLCCVNVILIICSSFNALSWVKPALYALLVLEFLCLLVLKKLAKI